MEADTLDPKRNRWTGYRWFWVTSAMVLLLLTMMALGPLFMRGRNRWAIIRGLPQNCSIQFDPVVPARVRSLIGEANCRRLFDRPHTLFIRCEDWKPTVLTDLSSVEELETLEEMEIRSAFIPKSQLPRIPAPPSVRRLRMANYLTVCSESCVIEAADTKPWKPEFAWEGKDMAFLSRFHDLRELELRAVWLRTGVMDVVGHLTQLEVLSLSHSDFPSDELPSLRRLQKLRVLTFWYPPQSMHSLEWLREMESLEELTLVGCRGVDAKMLAPLAQLPRLHTLRLDNGSLMDDVWPALAAFPHLKVLTLSNTNRFALNPFSADRVKTFTLAQAPQLWAPESTGGFRQLEWLNIENEYFYTPEALQAVVTYLPEGCKVVVNRYHLGKYCSLLPPKMAAQLTGELRTDLELPVEY